VVDEHHPLDVRLHGDAELEVVGEALPLRRRTAESAMPVRMAGRVAL